MYSLNRNVELLVVAPLPNLPLNVHTELSLKILSLSEMYYSLENERNGSPSRHSFFAFHLLLNRRKCQRKDQFDRFSLRVKGIRSDRRARFSPNVPMNNKRNGNVLSEGTTFHSRYFKAGSWPDYLHQVLYRAVRSTPYL